MFLFALLLSLPVAADEEAIVSCDRGYCVIRQDALQDLITNQKRLIAHVTELRKLCGWRDK